MSSIAVTLAAGRTGRGLRARAAESLSVARLGGTPASARSAAAALLAVEVLGSAMMWAPIPLACFWLGGRVYALTGSLGADVGAAFVFFVGTTWLAMTSLAAVDRLWLELRRRGGRDQEQGALPRVVIVTATLGLVAFFLWYAVLGRAYLIPFMPTR